VPKLLRCSICTHAWPWLEPYFFAVLGREPCRSCPAEACVKALDEIKKEAAEHGVVDLAAAQQLLEASEQLEKSGVTLSAGVSFSCIFWLLRLAARRWAIDLSLMDGKEHAPASLLHSSDFCQGLL
jgi:hypothetical protein